MTAARAATGSRTVAAGIVSRSLAAAVDLLVVLLLMGTVLLSVAGLRFLASPPAFRWPSPTWSQSLAVGGLLAIGYLTVAWATSGRSIGAAVLGLRVLSVGGTPLGWFRASLRAAFCLAFPPGLAWSVVSRRRRSVQDLLVGSMVVYDWIVETPESPPGGGPDPAEPGHRRHPRVKEEPP